MTIISLKCPNCGANLELDDGREFGFCQFCGTKVMIQQTVTQKSVVDESSKVPGYLEISESALHSGEYDKCIEYAEKVIIIQSDSARAWYYKGCAQAALANSQCTHAWEKALGYAENGSDLKAEIAKRLNNPDAYVKQETKKFKVIVSKMPALLQPTLHIFIDKDEVMAVKGGSTDMVKITKGKHKLGIRVNHRMFKSAKQDFIVDEKDVTLSFIWDKKLNDYNVEFDF